MASADENVTLARYAERAERYDEMAEFMKARVQCGNPLNAEERDMFSAAYKGSLTGRRHAVRVAGSVEAQEGGQYGEMAAGYKSKVNSELRDICNQALETLKNYLIQTAEPGEARVFYYKMAADYHRYIAESSDASTPHLRQEQAGEAAKYYHAGSEEAAATLPDKHPVRLGLALNFSVFQHEVLGDTPNAIQTARIAVMNAGSASTIPEEMRNDAMLTVQLLEDNLQLWENGQ